MFEYLLKEKINEEVETDNTDIDDDHTTISPEDDETVVITKEDLISLINSLDSDEVNFIASYVADGLADLEKIYAENLSEEDDDDDEDEEDDDDDEDDEDEDKKDVKEKCSKSKE
nr:MAG TPA: Rio2 kinase kinase, ADP complex, phosphoaspartate [Caudoviricetes sp.]